MAGRMIGSLMPSGFIVNEHERPALREAGPYCDLIWTIGALLGRRVENLALKEAWCLRIRVRGAAGSPSRPSNEI